MNHVTMANLSHCFRSRLERIHTYVRAYKHTYIHECTRTYIHTSKQTACMHIYICIYLHTYIHIYRRAYNTWRPAVSTMIVSKSFCTAKLYASRAISTGLLSVPAAGGKKEKKKFFTAKLYISRAISTGLLSVRAVRGKKNQIFLCIL